MNFSLVCAILSSINAISASTMQEFFPEIFQHGNLHQITWDHAVNSKDLLNKSLASKYSQSSDIIPNKNVYKLDSKHMIEADILLGQTINDNNDSGMKLIMAHPPATTSDLTLEEFLEIVAAHNKNPSKINKKGIKLDFKETEAYARAATHEFLLNDEETALKDTLSSFPIWINGDICRGPRNPLKSPIDMRLKSLQSKPRFMDAVHWSLGWTTGDYNTQIGYSIDHISEMQKMVEGIANLTFPVRAMYAAQSTNEMQTLLKLGTLTIWSAPQDGAHVDTEKLAKLLKNHSNRIYVDVPNEQYVRILNAMQ